MSEVPMCALEGPSTGHEPFNPYASYIRALGIALL